MLNGPRKGQTCDEYTTVCHGIGIPYCHKHSEKHVEEWEPFIIKRLAEDKAKEKEHKNKLDTEILNARKPNAFTIHKDRKNVPSLLVETQKTENTIEECVDVILNKFSEDIITYSSFLTPFSTIQLYPSKWRGWPKESIMDELKKRMFDVSLDTRNDAIFARARMELVML